MALRGKPIAHKTPYRQTFVAGSYRFALTKPGYHSWQRQLQVVPSEVTLADYVILVPQHIPTTTLQSFVSVGQMVVSPDHSRIALAAQAADGTGIWSLDTGSNQLTRIYTPAVATPTSPAETVQLLGWSTDNSHLLIRSQVGAKTSLVMVAASGTDQPINITDSLKTDATSLAFNPGNWQQLYWQSPDGLRLIDLGNQTISAPLANHVAAYTFAGGRIVYVDAAKSPASLWVMNSDGTGKQRLVAKLPVSQGYAVTYASYLGVPEVAVVAEDPHTTTLYSNIYDTIVAQPLPAPTQQVQFSPSGRFLLQYDASHLATYDLQQAHTTAITPGIDTTTLGWFDDNHLEYNQAGHAVLSEFDNNYAVAVARDTGLPPFSSADGKTIYITTTATNADGTTHTLLKALRIRQ